MARIESEPSLEPRLKLSQRVAVRLDSIITSLTDTGRQVAQIPLGELHDDPNAPTRVILHRRYNSLGMVRKAIAHIEAARGSVIGREEFKSEAELKQTWGQLQFKRI